MPSALAFRYARVLADLAGRDRVAGIAAELDAFAAAMRASNDLRVAMDSPAVAPARKQAVVTKLCGVLGISDLVRRFLFVVIDHRRPAMLPEIREAFEEVVDERLGVARADVASARQLSEAQRAQISERLAGLTGKRIRARFEIDPALIGGIVARVGSTVYDGSVRGQLESLKARLAGASE